MVANYWCFNGTYQKKKKKIGVSMVAMVVGNLNSLETLNDC